MADPALEACTAQTSLKISQPSRRFTPESLKAIILSLLLYWGTSSLLLPVTTSDCQVYNLARLSVAERAGFWQADAWNSIRQVTYPWTFDAVHYLFLKTGWGFGIPSFLAFLGLLVIVFQLVALSYGEYAALWSILTLLSMPTLMLQATTTKNDLAVVFGAGCWIYSLVRFRRSRNNFFLFTAALSLAFSCGFQEYSARNLCDRCDRHGLAASKRIPQSSLVCFFPRPAPGSLRKSRDVCSQLETVS